MANARTTPLINGVAYSWADVTMNIMGVPIVGVTDISYEEPQEVEGNYGAGNYPVSLGYGKVEPKASITLHMEEVEKITDVAPNRRVQEIPPFDIVVNFLRGTKTVTHKIRNAVIKTNKRELKQGDKVFAVQFDLFCSHIEW